MKATRASSWNFRKIAELERKLGNQKQIELEFKDKMIEIAEEMYRVDIKKARLATIRYFWFRRERLSCSLNYFYQSIGINKQAVHKLIDVYMRNQDQQEQLLRVVYQVRKDHPTMGMRDMYYKILPFSYGQRQVRALV